VPEGGEDEIGDLAQTFNAMAGSLAATERRRMQLVGDVAHELRTPPATLAGYLEGLEDGVIESKDETWRLLRSETARLTRLVDELAELWRAEAHQLSLKIEPVDLAKVCRDTAERFAPLASERQIDLALDLPSAAIASADRDRVSTATESSSTSIFRGSSNRMSSDRRPISIHSRNPSWPRRMPPAGLNGFDGSPHSTSGLSMATIAGMSRSANAA
jgi:light-regulated signal transduction histidine kinase (bacteriophytochrome)